MNQKKRLAIILVSILVLALVGAAVASRIVASAPYRLPAVHYRPTETPEPTAEPVVTEPTEEPVAEPTEEPATEPTEEPATEPTEEPVAEPTEEPVAEPTEEPATEPTEEPVAEPTETLKPYDGPIAIGNADVHAAPDANSAVVFTAPNGAAIKVFSTEGDWAKVEVHGFSGYLHRDHVRGVAFAQPAATTAPITENDLPDNVRLLGVIQDKLDAERSVSIYVSHDGQYITFGDTVTLYAVLHGYEDTVYTLQWQSGPDNASWADIPGAVSASYSVTVTEANYTDYYRVAVTINGVVVADELLSETAQ